MKIRSKISLYLGPFVLLTICMFFSLHYYLVRDRLIENAQTELVKMEKNIHRAAQALLSTAINSYLRGITEKNVDFIESQYAAFSRGEISSQQAKEKIQEHFNVQSVGDSGYLVSVEEKGDKLYLDLHPFLPKTDCTDTDGCQQWAKTRNGYTEYDWKNPSDNSFRKKAAYVQEFPQWNWIVGASSYRDEFVRLVEVEDLSRLISPIRINKTGYFFVFDENNKILIHPEFTFADGSELVNSRGENVLQLLKESNDGYLTYMWKNPSEDQERLKYAFIEKLEGYNWYLVASGYLSEVYAPIEIFKKITVAMIAFTGSVLLFIIYRLSSNISSPLLTLKNAIQTFYESKEEFIWKEHPIEEINILGNAFSRMTAELENSMSELQQTNAELAQSKRMNEESRLYLESIINSMPTIMIGVDPGMRVTQWNRAVEDSTGLSPAEVQGRSLFEVYELLAPHRDELKRSIAVNEVRTVHHIQTDSRGKAHHSEITIYPLITPGNEGAVILIDEITERVEMEQRLRQSQKMDAVGQLAGGIAHDFNNMLSGIVGSAELLRTRVSPEEQKLVRIITEASGRAGELIQKLLAFSRKESIAFVPVDFHAVIRDTSEILKRTLNKRISIETDCKAEHYMINGDLSQLQSSLLNIGINGGHAMPDGGTLSFVTVDADFDEKTIDKESLELSPGKYLQIEVRDTGCGISKEHVKHIFEPFFTTRTQKEGTGLGLAAVYGAIKQHKGLITVYSEVDRGSCFTIYLPLSADKQEEARKQEELVSGAGCVLIVDDEPIVRATAKMMLEKLGYETMQAENGHEGVDMYSRNKEKIDLVILDMLMPVMEGTECFYALREMDPHVRVIISSGFTRDADLASLRRDGLRNFVRKPYNMIELSKAVAKALQDKVN